MKKHIFTLLAALTALPCAQAQKIDVVYPIEGHVMSYGSAAYLFGNVKPAKGKLKINGTSVKMHENGAFITYLPVAPGPFAFNCELEAGTQTFKTTRNIIVGSPYRKPEGAAVYIDTSSLAPAADITARPGDWIYTSFRGAPGQKAQFSIRGAASDLPMPETEAGIYRGAYQVLPSDKTDKTAVQFSLSGSSGSATAEAGGKITMKPDFGPVIEITTDTVGVKTNRGAGYMVFLEPRQKLLVTGREGRTLKVKLSETLSGWVDENSTRALPEGTPPPMTELGMVSTQYTASATLVSVDGTGFSPWRAEETENGLEVSFYYAKSHTNWVVYDSSDTMVRDIRWRQDDSNTCTLIINLWPDSPLWGYTITRSKNGTAITLRGKPVLKGKHGHELAGLKVIVDPGHSPTSAPPYDGAIGPMRTMEYQHNMAMAKMLKTALEKHGATVVTTRQNTETVDLRERPRIAMREQGHLYISLHANALVDTTDPYGEPRGYSLYYYQPHSRRFAANIHRGLRKFLPLPDEGLRYGDYHVVRVTAMPAVLVEAAYLILPEQEMLLEDEAFRTQVVNACLHGIYATFGLKYTPPPFIKTKPRAEKTPLKKHKETMPAKTEAGSATAAAPAKPAEKTALGKRNAKPETHKPAVSSAPVTGKAEPALGKETKPEAAAPVKADSAKPKPVKKTKTQKTEKTSDKNKTAAEKHEAKPAGQGKTSTAK